jgi:hypothetical protein
MWLLHLYQPSGHAAPVPMHETRSRGRTLTVVVSAIAFFDTREFDDFWNRVSPAQ